MGKEHFKTIFKPFTCRTTYGFYKISSAITGNFIFLNISDNINHIQVIRVSKPMFSGLMNIGAN